MNIHRTVVWTGVAIFLSLCMGAVGYAYFSELVVVTVNFRSSTSSQNTPLPPQSITLFYPRGDSLISEKKSVGGIVTVTTLLQEWHSELCAQRAIISSSKPPHVLYDPDRGICIVRWNANPFAPSASIGHRALCIDSLRKTLDAHDYHARALFWFDEQGLLRDPIIAWNCGVLENGTATLSGEAPEKMFVRTLILDIRSTRADPGRIIGSTYERHIARSLIHDIKQLLEELAPNLRVEILSDHDELSDSSKKLSYINRVPHAFLLSIAIAPAPRTRCTVSWSHTGIDQTIYQSAHQPRFIPLDEAHLLWQKSSAYTTQQIAHAINETGIAALNLGGLPLVPLYGIAHPATLIECEIEKVEDISALTHPIAIALARVLREAH